MEKVVLTSLFVDLDKLEQGPSGKAVPNVLAPIIRQRNSIKSLPFELGEAIQEKFGHLAKSAVRDVVLPVLRFQRAITCCSLAEY